MSELKPCPFCGSDEVSVHHDEYWDSYWVSCVCNATITTQENDDDKHVKAAWNRRTQPEATKPAQDLSAAILAMNRAKLLPIWDNDVPHKLHVELDVIFKALAALASPADALVAGDSETAKDAALYREIRRWNPKQFTDAWARALSDKIKFDELVNAAIQAQKDGHHE